MDGEEVGRAMRLLLPPLLSRLRKRDLAAASGPDVFVANSEHVRERIARYYGRAARRSCIRRSTSSRCCAASERAGLLPRLRSRRPLQARRPGGGGLHSPRTARSRSPGTGARSRPCARWPHRTARPAGRRGRVPRPGRRSRAGSAARGGARAAVPGRGGLRHRAGRGAGGGRARDRLRRRRRHASRCSTVRRACSSTEQDAGRRRERNRALRAAASWIRSGCARTRRGSGASASAGRWPRSSTRLASHARRQRDDLRSARTHWTVDVHARSDQVVRMISTEQGA